MTFLFSGSVESVIIRVVARNFSAIHFATKVVTKTIDKCEVNKEVFPHDLLDLIDFFP